MRVDLGEDDSDLARILSLIKNDPVLKGMLYAKYDQVDNWIETNVTNIQQSQELLKRMLKVVMFLLRTQIAEMRHKK